MNKKKLNSVRKDEKLQRRREIKNLELNPEYSSMCELNRRRFPCTRNCRKFIIVSSDKLFTRRWTLIKSRQIHRAIIYSWLGVGGRENDYESSDALVNTVCYTQYTLISYANRITSIKSKWPFSPNPYL